MFFNGATSRAQVHRHFDMLNQAASRVVLEIEGRSFAPVRPRSVGGVAGRSNPGTAALTFGAR
jgi:hypothetical protein